jgi:DNA-binding GntR family transcriptional regulator
MATPAERLELALREMLRGMERGQALPSVRELADDFDVSQSTVAKVLGRLKADGLIVTKQGWGTFKNGGA